MDVKTAPEADTARQEILPERSTSSALRWTVLFFVTLWALFFALFHAFPYVRNGSDVVFGAKLRLEEQGTLFPGDPGLTRVLIFGNSKILAGFVPSRFEQLGAQEQHRLSAFNSGLPGSDLFLAPLQSLCARGQAPNILLLTLPWNNDPPRHSLFRFVLDDHFVVDRLFPFRNLLRDLAAFLLNAPAHGGIVRYYRDAQAAERAVVAQRGYHLITEQSRFPGGRLPDNFHIATDEPAKRSDRPVAVVSAQADALRQLIRQYHMDCYYVPLYLRQGEAAPAAAYDQYFAVQAAQHTGCQLIGPNYFLYPNRLFADQTHLNEQGALVYTRDLYQLLKEHAHALQ